MSIAANSPLRNFEHVRSSADLLQQLVLGSHVRANANRCGNAAGGERALAVRLAQPSAAQNKLLALLPHAAFERFSACLEWIPMPLGKVLYEAGDQLEYVYFPTTSIVSLSYALSDGASAEVAIVGNEGMVGMSIVMGCETTPTQAFVQSAGYGFRLKASVLAAELQHTGAALQLFLKYTQTLMLQMTQTAVCNRHHSLAQQLSRRLLLSLDRGSTYSLKMTQELMAAILGVRREGVPRQRASCSGRA